MDYAEDWYQEKYTYQEQVSYTEQYNYYERVQRGSGKNASWVNELRTGYRTHSRSEDRIGYRSVFGEIDGGIDTLQFGMNISIDPEIRYLPSGQAVANISIATSSRRKDKNSGETIEDTQWHRVTFYDRLAEIAGEYVKKGRPVYVEGRLKYGTYVDKTTGVEKNTVDIIATELQLLGGREGMGGPSGGGEDGGGYSRPAAAAPRAPAAPRQAPAAAPAQAARPASGFDDMDDDIPF